MFARVRSTLARAGTAPECPSRLGACGSTLGLLQPQGLENGRDHHEQQGEQPDVSTERKGENTQVPHRHRTQISDLDNRQAAYRHYREELDKPEPRLT